MNNDQVLLALSSAGLTRVTAYEPMTRHTSWRVGGPADFFGVAETENAVFGALKVAREAGLPWLVLGGGYNVLVSDAGIDGIVIANRVRGLTIEETLGEPQIHCGAGVFFAKVAQETARRGFTGMEWGIAIPGTVGGGVVNNAGAHWGDVAHALISATVADGDGLSRTMTSDDLAYHYRQSALKERSATRSRFVVTGCRFHLERDSPQASLARVDELRAHRLRTQPVKEPSAGSTFKNPPGNHAGALIESGGLKGYRLGGAQIAPMHANFILNAGGATAGDILGLMRLVQERVKDLFGVDLEPEVQFVGRWPDEALRSVLGIAA